MRLRPCIALFLAGLATTAGAHPHTWIDGGFSLEVDSSGLRAIQVTWVFDPFTSSDLLFSYDSDGNGVISRQESGAFYENAFRTLESVGYFVLAELSGRPLAIPQPQDFRASTRDARLIYEFTLPLRVSIRELGSLLLSLFDPSYYVSFTSEAVDEQYRVGPRTISLRDEVIRLESVGWGTIRVPALRVEVW